MRLIMTVKNVNCALNFKSNEKPAFYLVIQSKCISICVESRAWGEY